MLQIFLVNIVQHAGALINKEKLVYYFQWLRESFVEQFEKPKECDLLSVYLHIVVLTSFHYMHRTRI